MLMKRFISLDGYLLPAGVTIMVVPGATHNNPNVINFTICLTFPPNTQAYSEPMLFDPDRFLPEKIAARHPYDYIPFSAGQRNCIGMLKTLHSKHGFLGQKFALMEEKTVLANFFRKYRVETNAVDWTDNMPIPELILKPSEGFKVKLFKR
jgi:cytochrome P450